jgi:hypothetical protein
MRDRDGGKGGNIVGVGGDEVVPSPNLSKCTNGTVKRPQRYGQRPIPEEIDAMGMRRDRIHFAVEKMGGNCFDV